MVSRRAFETRSTVTADTGFSLVELLVALVVSIMVVGGAALMGAQMQSSYRGQLEAAAAQQEGRYALQWIERYLRATGNNPYRLETTDCPSTGLPVQPIRMDPDNNGQQDDIRVQMDASPTDGLIGGATGACNQVNEDVTISYNAGNNTITVQDNNTGAVAARTDNVIAGLQFVYRNPIHQITTNPANVAFIETRLQVRTKLPDQNLGSPAIQTVSSEVRVRSR
jgi:Tfp pilus assembly protein PilW